MVFIVGIIHRLRTIDNFNLFRTISSSTFCIAVSFCCLLASLHAIRKSRLDDEARAESMGLGGRRRYMRDDLATGYKREGSPEEREPLATADRAARRGPLGAPSGYGYGTEADERRPHPAGVAML